MPDSFIRRPLSAVVFLLATLLLGACSKPQTLQALFQQATPHEAYGRQLRQAGLDHRPAGRAWLAAAGQALRDSLVVPLPFAETGYFRPGQPTAASYRYAVQAGEQLHVRLELGAGASVRVFLDAFELRPGHPPAPLASADTVALDFHYRAAEDGQHLLRVQPELLAAGRYTLRIGREPGLGVFPVRGRSSSAVGSFWGATRDAGERRHEGIDIFAPRGTAAIAAAAGYVTRVGETPRGGRVVWLAAAATGEHLYYAHLDRQLVRVGQQVRPGDTLGLVGSTGNARTTPPHLHFGIYRAGQGAIDPLPFVRQADAWPAAPVGPDQRGEWVRLRKATRLSSYSRENHELAAGPVLAAHSPLLVLGRQGAGLRVETADGRPGYVPAAATVAASAAPLRRLRLPAGVEISQQPRAGSVALASWPARTAVAVLAEANGFLLLRGPAAVLGWARL